MWTMSLGVMAIGLALLLGGATSAWAADYCVDIQGVTLTLKAFSPPSKGACKPVQGFIGGGAFSSFITGSACKSSDGGHMSLALTRAANPPSITRAIDALHLDLPAGTGQATLCTVDTGFGGICHDFSISHVPCSPATVPVP